MRQSSALHVLVVAVTLVQSRASQPQGDQSIALTAVTEARDALKSVVQQLGEQQEQIDELTKEVAELRAAKKSQDSPEKTSPPVPLPPSTSVTPTSNEGSANKTAGARKVLASLRATAERAEHVLVAERPRTPWWAEKQHTHGPDRMHREGGYYGETNTDATFGRHRYYPAGWSVAPEHQPIHGYAANNGVTSYNVFAPDVLVAPPAPSPVEQPVPTLPPIYEGAGPPLEPPVSAAAEDAAAPPEADSAPPPPGGNELRPKSEQLANAAQGKPVPLKNTMGFFGPPPSGGVPNAPAPA